MPVINRVRGPYHKFWILLFPVCFARIRCNLGADPRANEVKKMFIVWFFSDLITNYRNIILSDVIEKGVNILQTKNRTKTLRNLFGDETLM